MKKKERWQVCNVVEPIPTGYHLWQLRAKGPALIPLKDQEIAAEEKLPSKVVTKTFQSFWKKKLNIALLPPGKVFVGVVDLPAVDSEELQGMLEFQLEKLSPLPVAQIVWTYHELPRSSDGMTRIVLVVASRHEVETQLGKLEGSGFLADRLEFPMLDEFLALAEGPDGLWLLPRRTNEEMHALGVWMAGGQLRNVTLYFLPETDWESSLETQLSQTVWSGELEGWLSGMPECHLVADEELAELFVPVLSRIAGSAVDVRPPDPSEELVRRMANRVASQSARATLLPPEISKRYHQSFVDGLWMRALGVSVLVYIFGVLLYFLGIEWAKFERTEAQNYLDSIAQSYTNAVQAAQRIMVLQNQMNLKYAALDSFRAVAENLPEGAQLNSFNFQRGNQISVFGTSPVRDTRKVSEFVDKLRVAESEGKPLFNSVRAPNISSQPATQLNRWDFVAELANPESK